jgi:acyl-CoA synthetase (AMP-forming)/AMP-acid ligase II
MPGVELCLVGGAGPEEGRLLLRSPMTLRAYVNRPELSAAKIVDGWYDTADLMRRDAAGFYYFVGRADDMMLVGGENVFPAEVERLLERHPEVAQAAVIAVPDEIKGEKPVAFVVLRPGAVFDEGALKTFTLANGPAYAHPRRVLQLAELPLSAANKVDQAALRKLLPAISA